MSRTAEDVGPYEFVGICLQDGCRESHKICSFIMGRRGRRPLQPRIDNRRRLHQTSLFSRRETSPHRWELKR